MSKETAPAPSIRVIRSETDAEQLDHFSVRFEAFKEATRFDGTHADSPYEVDLFDSLRQTRTLFTAYVGEQPAGAVRVLWGGSALGRAHGWRSGLPIEGIYDLGPLATSGRVAEPGRLCVLSEHRGSGVALHLIDAVFAACRERDVDLVIAPANSETDVAEDVAILRRVLAAKGLVSEQYHFARKGPPGGPACPERPYYDVEQRLRAASGSLTGLSVPRTLKLYARLGGRIAGDEIFDGKFGLFALPIAVPVPSQSLLSRLARAEPSD